MNTLETTLGIRSRRAYELGRLLFASRRAALLLPLMALSITGCGARFEVLACGAGLLVAVTLVLWRGQQYAAGVGPGIAAGLPPLLLPIVAELSGHLCAAGSCLILPATCAVSGLAGGILLGALAPRPRAGSIVPFAVACTIAALTGAMGCLLYGLIGLVVLAAGLAAGAVPLLAARRA